MAGRKVISLFDIQREMVLAHKRGAWDTVLWLAPIARELRTMYDDFPIHIGEDEI